MQGVSRLTKPKWKAEQLLSLDTDKAENYGFPRERVLNPILWIGFDPAWKKWGAGRVYGAWSADDWYDGQLSWGKRSFAEWSLP